MISGIYMLTNTVNGKIYVGSAVNFVKRERQHRSKLNTNKHGNQHLQSAWNKYGEDKFTFSRLLYCDLSDLLWFEQRALDSLGKTAVLYNLSPTAGSNLGMKFGPDVRSKVSMALKGRKYNLSEELRESRKISMTGNVYGVGNKGPRGMKFPNRQLSDQHKDLLRLRAVGREHTDATKKKISETMKRRRSCNSSC